MKKDLEKLGLADVKDWVFDLDNTIYPANSSLFPRVAERMTDFIMAHFNLSREEAAEMKTRLFRTYGTTMHGLMKEHNMSPDAFLAYVHEIDLSDVSYDGELDKSIARLPGRKQSHIPTCSGCPISAAQPASKGAPIHSPASEAGRCRRGSRQNQP